MSTVVELESIEIPNSCGARKSRFVSNGDTVDFCLKDATTTWEAFLRGLRVSENSRCIGWREGNSDYNWMTYRDFIDGAENFGSGLVAIGMTPGQSSMVGIYAQTCVEWLIAEYGCWSQSAIIVPFYDTLGPDASAFIINQAEIRIIICDTETKIRNILTKCDTLPSLRQIIAIADMGPEIEQIAKDNNVQLHSFKIVEAMGKKMSVPNLLPRPSDVMIVCYTSGTTGVPKGVIITHGNMLTNLSAVASVLQDLCTTKDDTTISYLPMAHIYQHFIHTLIFATGGSVGIFRGDINLLTEDMKVLKPTFFPTVPRLLNKIYHKAQDLLHEKSHSGTKIVRPNESDQTQKNATNSAVYEAVFQSLGGKLRLIFTGGAPISESVLHFCRFGLRCEILTGYGQTECSGGCTAHIINDNTPAGSVGPPLSCCVMKLVDVTEDGYFADKGEVCVKGYNVFKGYLNDPEKTSGAIDKDGWLHTGDIGTWLPNGTLKVLDRKKSIFKLSQGEYIAPEKITNIYSACHYISQIFIEGDSFQSYLVAVVIPEKEMVLPWSKENLDVEIWEEVCRNQAVKQLILDDIRRLGKAAGLCGFEQVKDIYLHPEPLTLEAGQLTPTMKAKRDVCRQFFKNEIEAMYRANKEYIFNST